MSLAYKNQTSSHENENFVLDGNNIHYHIPHYNSHQDKYLQTYFHKKSKHSPAIPKPLSYYERQIANISKKIRYNSTNKRMPKASIQLSHLPMIKQSNALMQSYIDNKATDAYKQEVKVIFAEKYPDLKVLDIDKKRNSTNTNPTTQRVNQLHATNIKPISKQQFVDTINKIRENTIK